MAVSIAIIGAGNIGQAIGSLLSKHAVQYWDSAPGKVHNQKPLAEVVTPAQIVFLAVPSNATRQAIENVRPFLNPHTIVATLAKGIEPGSLQTIDQVLLGSLPHGQPCTHLGGPMLASEIRAGKHAAAAVGSYQRSVFVALRKVFKNSTLRLEYSNLATMRSAGWPTARLKKCSSLCRSSAQKNQLW